MQVSKMALVATALGILAGCAGSGGNHPAADERPSIRDSLPEFTAVTTPELPFSASGQEPGWQITIAENEIFLQADFGTLQQRFPRTEPEVTAEGLVYRTTAAGRRLSVYIEPGICADVVTGMPHPLAFLIASFKFQFSSFNFPVSILEFQFSNCAVIPQDG